MIDICSVFFRKSSAIFGYLDKSSAVFRNFRKMFPNVHVASKQILGNLRKSAERDANLRKILKFVVITT